jgi:hypothetical protein
VNQAPMAVSQDGNSVYVVWWTNKSKNRGVMFRASTDGGQTFRDKINLNNSTDTESQNAEIVAAGENNVYVSNSYYVHQSSLNSVNMLAFTIFIFDYIFANAQDSELNRIWK